MTPEMQARVFEPFYTTKFTGRGLGLAVVHGIVRGHRGGVRVESAPQLGSTFSVALPAITQPADPLSRLAPSTDAWRSTGVVLVADDEDLVRDVADTMLRQIGFEVVAVQDGREAVAGLRRRPWPVRPGPARPDHADHERLGGAAGHPAGPAGRPGPHHERLQRAGHPGRPATAAHPWRSSTNRSPC